MIQIRAVLLSVQSNQLSILCLVELLTNPLSLGEQHPVLSLKQKWCVLRAKILLAFSMWWAKIDEQKVDYSYVSLRKSVAKGKKQ